MTDCEMNWAHEIEWLCKAEADALRRASDDYVPQGTGPGFDLNHFHAVWRNLADELRRKRIELENL